MPVEDGILRYMTALPVADGQYIREGEHYVQASYQHG